MSKNKSKYVNGYIVLQSGLVNRYIVGARSEKEAVRLCQEQIDKTARYRVYYRETNRKVPIGSVTIDKRIPNPYVEIDGDIYIKTDDYKITYNQDGLCYVKQKFVHRYAKSERDVIWKTVTKTPTYQQISPYYINLVEKTKLRNQKTTD